MRYTLWAGVLASLIVPSAARCADKVDIDDAINAGVAYLQKIQRPDGSWPYPAVNTSVGCTALVGLTLLECGISKDDPQIEKTANYVRTQSINLRHTYSIALAILFLDRLADSADLPLLESLAARLVLGQTASGGWSYYCPEPFPVEQRRLTELVGRRRINEGNREAPAPTKATVDSTREFRQRMATLNTQSPNGAGFLSRPDNSNTQFAAIALWVSRRHGFPVDNSIRAVERHFRATQNPDGGWAYEDSGGRSSSATMTCAGLIGLTVGFGVGNDRAREKGGAGREFSKDPALRAALATLSLAIGTPIERLPAQLTPPDVPPPGGPGGPGGRGGRGFRRQFAGLAAGQSVGGKSYYFLWSLERVAVALNMETIGKKDWYGWGTDVLLATQKETGAWEGDYGQGGVDTCFGLLFLKRSNLVSDLSKLTGRVEDAGQRVIKAGGVGGGALAGGGKEDNAIKGLEEASSPKKGALPDASRVPATPPRAPELGDSPGAKLATALVAMAADRQAAEIERLRDLKGGDNTDALATAIPYLSTDMRRVAREALARRVARMKAETLGNYLKDEVAEIRGAAALGCYYKPAKELIPQLIPLLADSDPYVSRATHAALKELSGKDLGPSAGADEAATQRAIADWQAWWKSSK
jgi:hypothetical protein